MPPKKIQSFAAGAVDETQGVYNKGNRPNWARGAPGAMTATSESSTPSALARAASMGMVNAHRHQRWRNLSGTSAQDSGSAKTKPVTGDC